ncbi:DUF4856 domain-containing protein [Spongiibacter sp. KMU-166]|uniref:DUF4856 domain-containing protein n=1 Tax=Spongiibacter thalassae TaxID=2721624 RepID=A0ABX1GM44_9GAMM|nr:DUF4856 domain-containing protein [Spongiibacter thalassae]NKI19407.1 DUF4856 domain-containing protein [Spongiibacter thalassae]
MKPNKTALTALAAAFTLLGACGGGSSSGGSTPTGSDNTPQVPTTYSFDSQITEGESAVSYTGQNARQILIEDLVATILDLTDNPLRSQAEVEAELEFYISGDVDNTNYKYALEGETVIPGPTYGDISTGKNLADKIAGGNSTGGGEFGKLINDEFFGWAELGANDRPIHLVTRYIENIAELATNGTAPTITVNGVPTQVDTVYVDEKGRDFRQLIQKFLLGAVNFSQGTNDYLLTDFAGANTQDGSSPYTVAEHKWDEAFGYFGAARDYNDYTDEEISGAGGREAYSGSYHDTDGNGSIDLRSEINFANSVNCAKRDRGSQSGTDFSKTTFDAFLAGRFILNQYAASTTALSSEQQSELDSHIATAAKTWEKCIASTVVHYINDVIADMGEFSNGEFASVENFTNLAKHWSEMKGFALGLQFSPFSPFRDGSVSGITVDSLKTLLADMGDAPVLADGSQNGVAASGTAQAAIDDYIAKLEAARSTLKTAYGFADADVQNW